MFDRARALDLIDRELPTAMLLDFAMSAFVLAGIEREAAEAARNNVDQPV